MKNNNPQKNIPDGWIKRHLGDVCSFANGKAHENNIVEGGKYIVVNSKFVSSNGLVYKTTNKSLSLLSQGDIAMVMSDIPNGKAIAKCYLVRENNKFTLNQRIGVLRSKQIDSSFLYYLLNRNKYLLSFDDGVNQTNLRKDDILSCPLIFPLLPEQKRIVSALEAWDHAIDKLAKKIKIKKNIKKGLMQNLLTGKIRLAGFTDEWKNTELGKVCEYKNGGSFEKFITKDGKYFLITLNSIDINGKLKNEHKKVDMAEWYLEKNDLIMVLSDIAHGYFLGLVDKISENNKYVLNQRMGLLRKKVNFVDVDFLRLYLNLYQKYFKMHGQGSSQQNLSKGDILKFKILLPKINEQIAIAKIIIVISEEIEALEKKLKILKDQKKYLLNNLITGAIRTKS